MTDITLRSDIGVDLVEAAASDADVAHAAWISSGRTELREGTDLGRLLKALLRDRHGSPFEHNHFTFRLEAPIFVYREWWRHRIASINEMSGRYTKLLPEFYTPDADRPLVNSGTKMRPKYERGTTSPEELEQFENEDLYVARVAWTAYENRLARGVAHEMARTVLPVSTYSRAYWTVNARGLMNFLSLRVGMLGAAEAPIPGVPAYPSHPQREIEMGAQQVEAFFAEAMPLTYAAFVAAGRVAP